ncbi:hypothetical protein [Halorientalis regularis]|jgi:hypothetical protein|uniref:DUF1616 domain-containing protein n=1 Tax=Halorientalis regularis TaxID=660518 RepID=A0A1G7HP79_9EURY|nr:hypothetical protein [Halorientalis regularis]SDF02265.1 hypothetical protein SAMN05216218_103108 [Halorientalis regularis]
MSNREADASGSTGWLNPEKAIIIVCAAIALPVVYFLTERLGTITYPAIFPTLAIVFMPPFVYRSYWSNRYDVVRATGWGLVAGIAVAAEFLAIIFLAAPALGGDGAVLLAFGIVVPVDYAVARFVIGR